MKKTLSVLESYVNLCLTHFLWLIVYFSPPLSTEKRLALRTIAYFSATKVLLVFETPFWERDNNGIKGGATYTDLNIKQIFYPMSARNSSMNLPNYINISCSFIK